MVLDSSEIGRGFISNWAWIYTWIYLMGSLAIIKKKSMTKSDTLRFKSEPKTGTGLNGIVWSNDLWVHTSMV
jgi:hypothetical protein